jgi:hypothetical protein
MHDDDSENVRLAGREDLGVDAPSHGSGGHLGFDNCQQIIPDTYVLFEYTLDPSPSPTSSWTAFADVYSGLDRDTNETWTVNQVAAANLASATGIRLSQQSSSVPMQNRLVETTPRDAGWRLSTTNPTPFPIGDTFMGDYHYSSTQSGNLSITLATFLTHEKVTEIAAATWFNPTGQPIDLRLNPNKQIIMTRPTSGSYDGPVYMSESSYTLSS